MRCNSIANNGRSSAIADGLRILVGKKNLEITKMTDHFSHTQKKDFKTAKPEKSFFSNFIIQLHLTSLRIQIHKERVFKIYV